MSSHTFSKVKKLTKEEEADLIIERLKRTDAEREADFLNDLEESIARIAAQALADEIDNEIIEQIRDEYLNKITKQFPELKE